MSQAIDIVSLRTRLARASSPAPITPPSPGAMPKIMLATVAVIVSGMNRVNE